MKPLDTEEGFEPVPRQTARTYVYTEESEAGSGMIVVEDPVAVRPTKNGQDVIHREEDDTLSIIRIPWGFLDMHIAEKREFSEEEERSVQDARDVMENGSDTEPANYMPCMNDPQGVVSVGNECIYYPECGCQRPEDSNIGLDVDGDAEDTIRFDEGFQFGDGGQGPPPNLDV